MESCTLFPYINGKKSELYKGIYDFTGEDRPLTNLLYAVSMLNSVKRKFNKLQKNTQGEIKPSEFIKTFLLQDIINTKHSINKFKKLLKAVDNKGNIIFYETAEELISRVLDFNNESNNYKALIKAKEGKFVIEVDTVNAENFNAYETIKRKLQQYSYIVETLLKAGLSTNFSSRSRRCINTITIKLASDTLKDLISLALNKENNELNNDEINLTESLAYILLDLFLDTKLVERIKNLAEEDFNIAKAVALLSGNKNIEDMEIDDTMATLIKRFINNALTTINNKLSAQDINNALNEGAKNIENGEFLGISNEEIQKTLKDLYSIYHIDVELIESNNSKIKKISEAARLMLFNSIKELEQQEREGLKNSNAKYKLARLLKDIEAGKYIDSIILFLQDIQRSVLQYEESLKILDKKLKNNPSDIETINDFSKLVQHKLDLVTVSKPIVSKLMNAKNLDNDDAIQGNTALSEVINIALDIYSILGKVEETARNKLLDIVQAFLKLYIGDSITLDGKLYSVELLVNMAAIDINMFDRLLYAANLVSDPILATVALAVKENNNNRDDKLKDIQFIIRVATDNLFKSGSNYEFMFVRDLEGNIKKIASPYDYDKFYKERNEYRKSLKELKLSYLEQERKMEKWNRSKLKTIYVKDLFPTPNFDFLTSELKDLWENYTIQVPYLYERKNWNSGFTQALKDYYNTMMTLKAIMSMEVGGAAPLLYSPILLSNNLLKALGSASDINSAYRAVKNNIIDIFKRREDDSEYGDALYENGIVKVNTDALGREVMTLPLFFTHSLLDKSRLSNDFSRSMMAFSATSVLYSELNKVIDVLTLTKDWMLNREISLNRGEKVVGGVTKFFGRTYTNTATLKASNTNQGKFIEDFYERAIYKRKRKDAGTFHLFGAEIQIDKATDALIGYSSIVGLTTNLLGAEVNVLIGKLQMLIETGLGMGGEFFNMKDMAIAEGQYFSMLAPLLNEVNSNNRSSKLGLLLDKFDALGDYYEKLQETGFYKSPVAKILGNKSMFFLYGLGEHWLRGTSLLAVLNHTKIKKRGLSNSSAVSLLEAFEVEKIGNNGKLKLKEGYITADDKEKEVNEEFIRIIKNRAEYVSESMHGAFGDFEKGMIHRYAWGRLIMNFRLWMPAHYARRFRGRHYDALLGEEREGYYVSSYKFVQDCVKGLAAGELDLITRWQLLGNMEKYNIKRAIAEVAILTMISASLCLLGDEKDKKGNWAYRHLVYLLKRSELDLGASTPINIFHPISLFENAITILNSPIAALKTVETVGDLVDYTDMFETIESGRYKGENKWLHNAENALPFWRQIERTLHLDEEDYLFLIFPD